MTLQDVMSEGCTVNLHSSVCVYVCMSVWGGVFLEGGLADFLLPGTVNTGSMDHGCVVHACVFVHVFSHLRSPGVRHAAEPDADLPNTAQTQALALNALGMQCLVILAEVFQG